MIENHPVFFVGVHCPPDELARREKVRGDRTVGQAIRQLDFVHQQNEVYDMEVNTFSESLEAAAKEIEEKVLMFEERSGWKTTVENFKQTTKHRLAGDQ